MIELGAGTGALSVALSRAGAASMTCTDLPCHMDRIKATVKANIPDNGNDSTQAASAVGSGNAIRRGILNDDNPNVGDEGAMHVVPLRWGDGIYNICSVGNSSDQSIFLASEDSNIAMTVERNSDIRRVNGGVVEDSGAALARHQKLVFDYIVLSEVLYWPALDLLQEDTREPLRSTLVELSEPGTTVVLVYKER